MYRKCITSYLFVFSLFLGIHSFDLYAYNPAAVLCGQSTIGCGYIAVSNPVVAILRGATKALAVVVQNAHQTYLKKYADKDDSFFTVMPDAVTLADRFYYELRKNELQKVKQELLGVKNDLEKIRALYAFSFTHQFLQKHAYHAVKIVKLLSVAQEKKLSDVQKRTLRELRDAELALLELQIQEIQFLLAMHVNQLIDNVHHAQTLYDDAISTIEAAIDVWNNNLNVMTHEIALRTYRHDLLREDLVHHISQSIDELLAVINYYRGCTNTCIEKCTNIITVLEHLAPAINEKRQWVAQEKDIVRNNIVISEQYCARHNISTISLKNEAAKEFEKQKKARVNQILQKVEMALSSSGFGGGPKKDDDSNDGDSDEEDESKDSSQAVQISKDDESHMFANRSGHLINTPANRKLLIDLSSSKKNFLGLDSYGSAWYAKIIEDGKQLWSIVRNGLIRNGGINNVPREFHPKTGLCKPFK